MSLNFQSQVPPPSRRPAPAPDRPLTARQVEILMWVQEGKTAWEIGLILGLSGRSVDSHLRRIYRKLDVGSRMQAVLRAQRLGVLDPPP